MAQGLVRYYLAASLDGFIGAPDGDVSWLEPYPPKSLGFNEFLAGIGTIIMGRASFEQILEFGPLALWRAADRGLDLAPDRRAAGWRRDMER